LLRLALADSKTESNTSTPKIIAVLADGIITIKPLTTEIIPNATKMLKPSEPVICAESEINLLCSSSLIFPSYNNKNLKLLSFTSPAMNNDW